MGISPISRVSWIEKKLTLSLFLISIKGESIEEVGITKSVDLFPLEIFEKFTIRRRYGRIQEIFDN